MHNLAEVLYEGVHCRLGVERPAPGVVVVTLAGCDVGEFGDVPMQELEKDLHQRRLIELFIDARAVKLASVDVSGEWAQWLGKHRGRFRHISMLTGCRFIQVTATFVRRFAQLGEVMRIYTEAAAFDEALAQSIIQRAASAELFIDRDSAP
jgi:hypothetical protein